MEQLLSQSSIVLNRLQEVLFTQRAGKRCRNVLSTFRVLLCALVAFWFSGILQAQTVADKRQSLEVAVRPDAVVCAEALTNCTNQDSTDPGSPPAAQNSQPTQDWVSHWLTMVDETRLKQPHYVAPLITTHVLLVQQFRFDSYYQQSPTGVETDEYGSMKGLEIIPNSRMEFQVGIPPYFFRQSPSVPDGFGDVSIFLKFRAFSAPEGKGEYFVGFFLGGQFPSGTPPNGLGHTVWSPMIAAAKGWRSFDVQSTLSGTLPQSGTSNLGRQILFNNTFQVRLFNGKLWPQLETNSTFFVQGPHSGDKQTFLTPGLILGRFKIARRLHFVPGAGVQIAASHFHLYDHRWIWTARFPF